MSLLARAKLKDPSAGYATDFVDLCRRILPAVRAKGIRLTSAPQEPGKPPTEIRIDDAKIRISLLGLLLGRKDVTFRLETLGGVVDGEYEERGKDRFVDVNLDGVELKQVDALTQMLGVAEEDA